MGLLSDENGKINFSIKNKVLNMLGFKTWENYEHIDELHRKRACKENLNIINLAKPLEVDNHEVHIEEHIKYLISDIGESLQTDKKDSLLNHINEHKKLLNL